MASFEEALYALWPNGDHKIPGLRRAIINAAPHVLEKYGINTRTAFLQFMAQISHECGAGLEIEENLVYSAKRMMEVWPSRFRSIGEALPYANNPRALANKVYNGRMGNAIGTDDGWNYRGRGATQTTGKDGYYKLGERMGLDLLGNPDLVNMPQFFLECGAADFEICGCLLPALSNDIYHVTLKLNGGTEGLGLREEWLSKWINKNVVLPIASYPIQEQPNVVKHRSIPSIDGPPPVRRSASQPVKGFWERLIRWFMGRN